MASASATAYRNSDDLKSANFAPPQPSPLVRRIDASRLPTRYRVTLKHFVIESQHGPDLWASTFRASFAAGVSYKTMQRHIDWLEREKILHKKHAANEFISGKGLRRPATYVLNGTSAKWLAPRETYPQWQRKNRRQAPPRKGPHVIKRSSHSTPEPVAPQAAPAPVASPAPPTPPAPPIAPMRRLTPREGPKLVNEMRRLMKGVQGTINTEQGLIHIAPNDARYRPPMSQENAMVAACMNLGIPYESAREFLKLLPRGLDEDGQGP